jgi:carbon-monoxide dehydrogenase medium subunit
VAAAALVQCSNGVIREARLALGGISDRPIRSADVEAAAVGRTADELSAIVGEIGGIDPVTDTNATAEHRRRLARVLTVRALADACRRAGEPA